MKKPCVLSGVARPSNVSMLFVLILCDDAMLLILSRLLGGVATKPGASQTCDTSAPCGEEYTALLSCGLVKGAELTNPANDRCGP
jgi:hypothetical protein